MPAENTEHRKLAAIMFTDMVGYSATAQRDEALALDLLEEHRRIVRGILPVHGGREVKTTGDGFLLEFPSALAAVQGAVEIQVAIHERNELNAPGVEIRIRIGIHVGDVVMRDGDIHGDGVNIAARIEPLAPAGGICISSAVHEQVRNKLSQQMLALGPAELKNIELAMVVHRIVLPWETTPPAPARGATLVHGKTWMPIWTGLALLAAGSVWWWNHHSFPAKNQAAISPGATNSPAGLSAPAALDQKSVAVLPFVNMSADKDNEYFSDGLTEQLTTSLSQIKGLHIKGRTSAFVFKGKNENLREIGRQLGVANILEGSVQKAGGQVRISAQLINVTTDEHLWATNYDRALTNIFAIQSDVAERVADALRVALLPGEKEQLAKMPTQSLEAYEFYMLGRQHSNKRTEAGYYKAIDYFKRAIANDPDFGLAYAGLADSYAFLGLGIFGAMAPNEAFPAARKAAEKALERNEGLAEAHTSLALVHLLYDWDWESTEKEFLRALELNPNYPVALSWYGFNLDRMGRFEEGLIKVKRAKELDPLAGSINLNFGVHFYYARDYDRFIEQNLKMLELDASLGINHWGLGRAYVQKGMYQDAITEFNKALSLSDDSPRMKATLGHAMGISGRKADAQRILDELRELSMQKYVSADCFAFIYIGLGEKDQAFESIERAVAEHAPMLFWLKVDPMYDSLRSDPRFVALLKKMRLDK